jgi:hypothetical protein
MRRRGYRDNPSERRELRYWPWYWALLGLIGGLILLYATWWLISPYIQDWLNISSTPISQVTIGQGAELYSAYVLALITFIGGVGLTLYSFFNLIHRR